MERKLREVDNDIEATLARKERLAEELAQVTHRLLELGSERNAVLGRIAGRHLYVVPNVIPFPSRQIDGTPDSIA